MDELMDWQNDGLTDWRTDTEVLFALKNLKLLSYTWPSGCTSSSSSSRKNSATACVIYFRCNNCFLLLVYTNNLSISADLVDPPPMGTFHMKQALLELGWSKVYYSTPLAPQCQGRSTSLHDVRSNCYMYFYIYRDMYGRWPCMYTVDSI